MGYTKNIFSETDLFFKGKGMASNELFFLKTQGTVLSIAQSQGLGCGVVDFILQFVKGGPFTLRIIVKTF